MNFSGEYLKYIDDKGRMIIPLEFRERLIESGNYLVITKNMHGGLSIFPPIEWNSFTDRLNLVPPGRQRNALNRLYLAPKAEIQIDKQGRITLSHAQRKWLGLEYEDREVVLVGNFLRIDLFGLERYQEVVAADVALIKENEELINQIDLP